MTVVICSYKTNNDNTFYDGNVYDMSDTSPILLGCGALGGGGDGAVADGGDVAEGAVQAPDGATFRGGDAVDSVAHGVASAAVVQAVADATWGGESASVGSAGNA